VREERTAWVLADEVMVALNRERIDAGAHALTDDDVDAVIQRVLDGIFAVEKLADAMRDPDVENVLVKGAGAVRVEFASGRVEHRPPIVASDADLLAIIRDQALAADRPFSYRVPYVDLQLPDGSRFHAEGFDIVDAPVVTIRRPRLLDVDLDELVRYGSLDPVLADLLTRSVRAGLVIVVSGLMNSGKTTMLRALCLSGIRPDEVIVTVETDFELGLHRIGRFAFVSAKQSRIPANDAGGDLFDCARLMELAVRNNATRVLVGEIRSSEAAAFVDGISVGRGAMSTVHGFGAADGLARIARLMNRYHDVELAAALDMLYGNVDLVVHVERSAAGRYVREVVAPSVEGETPKITPLWVPGPDRRAVPAPIGLLPAALADRLVDDDPAFDPVSLFQPARYRPLVRPLLARPAAVPA
jgi:Flp pilus assembly CpaF family ATPase